LELRLDASACYLPGRTIVGDNIIPVDIKGDLTVSLWPAFAFAEAVGTGKVKADMRALSQAESFRGGDVNLAELLKCCAVVPQWLFNQVVWQAGALLDDFYRARSERKLRRNPSGAQDDPAMEAHVDRHDVDMDTDVQRIRFLNKYLDSGFDHFSQQANA
jgi:hypothetical protein